MYITSSSLVGPGRKCSCHALIVLLKFFVLLMQVIYHVLIIELLLLKFVNHCFHFQLNIVQAHFGWWWWLHWVGNTFFYIHGVDRRGDWLLIREQLVRIHAAANIILIQLIFLPFIELSTSVTFLETLLHEYLVVRDVSIIVWRHFISELEWSLLRFSSGIWLIIWSGERIFYGLRLDLGLLVRVLTALLPSEPIRLTAVIVGIRCLRFILVNDCWLIKLGRNYSSTRRLRLNLLISIDRIRLRLLHLIVSLLGRVTTFNLMHHFLVRSFHVF